MFAAIVRPVLGAISFMFYRKLLIVVGTLGIVSPLYSQNSNSPTNPGPVSPTPFIADPTQAEKPAVRTAPTPAPDLSFPSTPMAPAAPRASSPQAAAPGNQASGIARAMPVSAQEILTRLQIFLDQRSFGPGKIDGRWGEFTAKALLRYQIANGQNPTGQIDSDMQKQLEAIFPIYTTYTVTADDLTRIDPSLPYKPPEQAKKKAMPYRSLSEFIGERFHSDPEFIVKLNREKKVDSLKPGATVRVPNVPPFRIEDFKELGDLPVKAELAKRVVKIDTRYRMLDVYDGDKLICSYPITPGSTRLPAPVGTWQIVGIATMPWFRWDEAMLNHGERSENYYNIPPGPRNPVGIAWIGLSKRGIGIHGTNNPDTIGRAGSHGCIRLANWDAARVINQVTDGMTVKIY
jgi:lipoprotein-anchoring transpeptidase ErfK/SrfK